MPKCHIPSCLGHSGEQTAEAACTRCGGPRWTLLVPTDYLCLRCRAVLAGRPAMDPLQQPPSPAQHAARAAAGVRLTASRTVLPSIPSGAEAPQIHKTAPHPSPATVAGEPRRTT